jgi:hypothetical protein
MGNGATAWAMMKSGASIGRMPMRVSLSEDAIVTVGE